ncbi:MAG: hypothetical protein JKY87_02425 [Mariprofundus sp.]|nr:hypothetical protein [Mariprofundus sp.]
MNESQIKTTQDIERLLLGDTNVSMSLEGNKQDIYNWIERTLVTLAGEEGERPCASLY